LYAYGFVYFNNYYSITAVNALTGKQVWSTYLSREDVSQDLTYSYGRLYSVDELGVLYEFNALTGAKVSYVYYGCDLHSAPTLWNGSLYMGTNEWDVVCLGDAAIITAQPAVQVIPTPTPTPTATPTSTPPPSTAPPLRQGVTWDQLYAVTLIIIVAVIIAIGLVAAAVLIKLRKIERPKP
jgi:hypothetical protein